MADRVRRDWENEGDRTFAFVKPANIADQLAIIHELRQTGFKVVREETRMLDIEILREHYKHHVNKPFFQPMAEYLMSGEVILLLLEREDGLDPVQYLRDLVGPTDPKKGKPGQIRHDFGIHDPEVVFKNAIHASGTPLEAKEEIARFFVLRNILQ